MNPALKLWELFGERRWDEARELLSEDFVAVWPQSRERIVGRDNFIAINREYPGTHEIRVVNHRAEPDGRVATETWIRSSLPDGKTIELFAVSFFEVRDGRLKSATEYWGETYPAPEWRRRWVEPA